MSLLFLEKQANIDIIKDFEQEYFECYKDYFEQMNIVISDETKDNFEKMVLKSKLTKEYKRNEKYYDEALEMLKSIKDSNLLFYIGSQSVVSPTNKKDKEEIIATIDYFYAYDKEHIASVARFPMFGKETKRIKKNKEIDVHSLFEPLSKNSNDFIKASLGKYVVGKIRKSNFETWDELRASINQDLAENKDILNERENFSSREEYISNQNTNSSNEQEFFSY